MVYVEVYDVYMLSLSIWMILKIMVHVSAPVLNDIDIIAPRNRKHFIQKPNTYKNSPQKFFKKILNND